VYSGGTGYRSRAADFEPLPQITSALENAFYLSFGNVEPTGKRTLLALDVSGSMAGGEIGGVPGLTPMDACAALAMVTARAEWGTDGYPLYHSVAFSHNLIPFSLAPDDTLRGITERMNKVPFGGTDCSLPIKYALDKGIQVDAFITYTDSETWAGRYGHPAELIQKYRKESGIPARMVVVGLTATDISIADPQDAGMLDVVGFDSAAPGLISSFVKGEI
jgi:60 kDa SS-A/Ro ribonucleoprotein